MDPILDIFKQSGSELIAVIVGGVLATAGGFLANLYEDRREQKRQEAHLRQVLLDALRTVNALYDGVIALERHYYEPGWYRAMSSLRNEYDVFQRNRELMIHLNDPALRTDIANFMIRLVLVVDGFRDDQATFQTLEDDIEAAERAGDPATLERLQTRLDQQKIFRTNRHAQLLDIISAIPDLTKRLRAGLVTQK